MLSAKEPPAAYGPLGVVTSLDSRGGLFLRHSLVVVRMMAAMTLNTTAYVSFPGNAREMLEYYHSVFGGELEILTYGEQLDNGVQFPLTRRETQWRTVPCVLRSAVAMI